MRNEREREREKFIFDVSPSLCAILHDDNKITVVIRRIRDGSEICLVMCAFQDVTDPWTHGVTPVWPEPPAMRGRSKQEKDRTVTLESQPPPFSRKTPPPGPPKELSIS